MEIEERPQVELVGEPPRPAAWLLLFALFGGNVALAIGPWFVRIADTGPVSAGFWRLFLALPFLVLLAKANHQRLTGMGAKTLALVALGAVTFALDLASWHIGIEMTRMANATLFGNSGSILLMVGGLLALRRKPRATEVAAVCLAMLGAALLLGRSMDIDRQTLVGDLFCITAGLLYVGYILLVRNIRGRIGPWSLLFWSSLAGAPVMLAVAITMGEPVWPSVWWPLIGLMLACQALLDAGDEVVLFSPAYDAYAPLVRRAGGVPVFVPLHPHHWEYRREAIEAALSSQPNYPVF